MDVNRAGLVKFFLSHFQALLQLSLNIDKRDFNFQKPYRFKLILQGKAIALVGRITISLPFLSMLSQFFSANQSILMLEVFFLGKWILFIFWMWPFALPVTATGLEPDKVVWSSGRQVVSRSRERFLFHGEISFFFFVFLFFFRLKYPIKDREARHADLALHKNMYLQKTLATFTTTHCSWGLGVAACGFMVICPRPNGRQGRWLK